MNEFKRMQKLAGIITELQLEKSYSTERLNPRSINVSSNIVNNYFDTLDIIPLDNGNKIQITTTYWYRDNSDDVNFSEVKAVLLDPSGKKLANTKIKDRFELNLGKKWFIPQIIATFNK
jgi:hypothetical protein